MGGKAKAPDYSSLAAASKEEAQIMGQLGQDQLAFNKEQYQAALPFVQDIARVQADAQRQQMAQAQDYYNYYTQNVRPEMLAQLEKAKAYNTEAKREELAQQAAADTGQAFQQTQAANERAMASMGVNPNSGRFAGMQRGSQLALAAQRANAMTGTRQQAEAMGHARMMDAMGLNTGMPGLSQAAYSGATGAGSQAAGVFQQPWMNAMQGMGQGASTIGSGQQMYLSGLGNALSGQASMYNNQSNPWMQLGGAVLGGFLASSKDYKTAKRPVDAEGLSQAMADLPVDAWRYKPGIADGGAREHVGAYAEDMAKLGAASPDGKAIDIVSALGVNTAAIKGLSQRMARVERAEGKANG